jgi:predicted MFS family arabinose efflux permease
LVADAFNITVSHAGWTVGVFALGVAVSALFSPLLLTGIDRKKVMLLSLGVFAAGNIVSMFTSNFLVIVAARALPAFFHPVYISMAFTMAASSVKKEEAPKAVSKIFIGVSLGAVLGMPLAALIASEASFSMAMLFFAMINAGAFAATAFLVPSMPVTEKHSYGKQIAVLKKPALQHSLITFVLLNSGICGFLSYASDYLKTVTNISFRIISGILFVITVMNILGNIAAGKILVKNAAKSILIVPLLLAALYILLFMFGAFMYPVIAISLVFGILAGMIGNIGQYMVSSAASEAADFVNGLYLSSANLGVLIGTSVCGLFIPVMGIQYIVLGALLFLAASVALMLTGKHNAR